MLRGTTIDLRKVLERDRKAAMSQAMKNALDEVSFSRSMVSVMDLRATRSLPDFEKSFKKDFGEFPGIVDLITNSDGLAVEISLGTTLKINATLLCKDGRTATGGQKIQYGGVVLLKKQLQEQRAVLREFADVLGDVKNSSSGSKITATVTCQAQPLINAIKNMMQPSR